MNHFYALSFFRFYPRSAVFLPEKNYLSFRLTTSRSCFRLSIAAWRVETLRTLAARIRLSVLLLLSLYFSAWLSHSDILPFAAPDSAYMGNRPARKSLAGRCYYNSYRLCPKKNSASIPGPTWAPVKGSWGHMISSLGGQISLIRRASASASSGQSPWVMATR